MTIGVRRPQALPVLLLALASAGCLVTKKDYDACVSDAAKARTDSEAKAREDAGRLQDLGQRLAAAESGTQSRDAQISDLTTAQHNVQAQLDEATAINQQLRTELERLGKDVDKMLAERGTLSNALDDAKTRLDELRRAQAAAEARTTLFRDFERRFKPQIDAGQMRVATRRGRLVLEVNGDLVFEAGHAEIRSAGKGVLLEVARALQTAAAGTPPRRFLVTTHVDDAPIKSKRFHTTWELTAAQAAAVVDLLVSVGVPGNSVAAAGAGAFDPIGPNDSADDRAKNRRVEISLLPSADELPATPQASAQRPL
jgi:flagellar motor protein MotB